MSRTAIRIVARVTLAALVWALLPVPVLAARLEGYVLGVDGRAAPGYRVYLVDDEGRDVAQSATSAEGVYRFRDLSSGAYSLGIENPEGQIAPVASAPIRLGQDELARRDVKLVRANHQQQNDAGKQNESFGVFWAGLSPAAKAWSVIGVFVILGITIKALDDDDPRGTQN